MKEVFYITTAIDYVNSKPHIGTAYEKIAADAIARFQRVSGSDVMFLMGTDEHSLNVSRQAEKLGKDPILYCDEMSVEFQRAWKKLNISFDDFIRTTEKRHVDTVTSLFQTMAEKGDVYKDIYEGPYCESCEAFIKENELKEGLCPVHRTPASWIKEDNYFFRLSRYGKTLLDHIDKHPEFIQPEIRKNEIVNVITGGLEDISISRSSMTWGIPLPQDSGQVVYVWFDALINYISGLGFSDNREKFEKYWPASVHVIGKDITRFHCIIWPAMLLSVGLPLPRTVFGHGFISIKGEKMSKTSGTVVYPVEISEKYGADALRYFLLREISFDKDGDFSIEKLEARYNADLANDLGNLLSRVVTLAEKKLGGVVQLNKKDLEDPIDKELIDKANLSLIQMKKAMQRFDISGAIRFVWEFIARCNQYTEETEPWKLMKDPEREDRFKTVLFCLVESLRWIGLMVFPFVPGSSERLFEQIGLGKDYREKVTFDDLQWGKGPNVFHVVKKDALFPRLEKKAEIRKDKI